MNDNPTSQDDDMARKRGFSRSIADIYKRQPDPEKVRLELAALVELGLGRPLDERTFGRLATAQADLRKRQAVLAAELSSGKRSPDDYLAALYDALHSWADRAVGVLGRERFDAIFGEAGSRPEGIIDRDCFFAEEQRRATAH